MSGARRQRLLAVVAVLAGAGLVVLAASRDWVTQQVSGVPGVVRVTASGAQAAPAVGALAVVAGAVAVVLLIAGPLAARLAGVLAVLAGAGVVAAVVAVLADPRGAAASAVSGATGRAGLQSGAASPSVWVWLALVGGVLVAAGGLLAVLRSGRWPVPGRRFETGTGRGRPRAEGPGAVAEGRPQDAVAAWDALSRGEDPTGRPAAPADGDAPRT